MENTRLEHLKYLHLFINVLFYFTEKLQSCMVELCTVEQIYQGFV